MGAVKEINIAVVDVCEFTLPGVEQLLNREPLASVRVCFYKNNAMTKLNVMRGPDFHQQIRCILS